MSQPTGVPALSGPNENRLIEIIAPMIAPLGYEVVHLEIHNLRTKMLRIFIDRLETTDTAIGVEDCVKVTRAIDEPLDLLPEVEAIFKGSYELEVSSPGVDRPLRQERDYERFSGREARIHVYRPLTAEELGNPEYVSKNPRQKHFLGTLQGIRNHKVLLTLSKEGAGAASKKGKPKKGKSEAKGSEKEKGRQGDEVMIPLDLIAKANLEPHFEELE